MEFNYLQNGMVMIFETLLKKNPEIKIELKNGSIIKGNLCSVDE